MYYQNRDPGRPKLSGSGVRPGNANGLTAWRRIDSTGVPRTCPSSDEPTECRIGSFNPDRPFKASLKPSATGTIDPTCLFSLTDVVARRLRRPLPYPSEARRARQRVTRPYKYSSESVGTGLEGIVPTLEIRIRPGLPRTSSLWRGSMSRSDSILSLRGWSIEGPLRVFRRHWVCRPSPVW